MKKKNQQAAEVIFKTRNKNKGDMYMDLHGLFVEEAIDAVEKRLKQVIRCKNYNCLGDCEHTDRL